ncbi:LOW QUALITY PROTEIN: DNA repair protein XRCC1 [Phalacrocorax carbo]|uniref:LOW QUALITY PROTEIN: DNA repair protein XRCC1 n=1 Tax=Phalacrocorax carbo TaxID=9209 RepID=UPI003119D086
MAGTSGRCEGDFRSVVAAMPEIPFSRVVSVTSADPRHPAENLLQPDGGGRWRAAAAGEKQISVVLELPGERPIHALHIGNDGSAFVEVLVGAAAGGDFQVLLPTAAFMSPSESRAGAEPRRVRLFGPEALVKGVAGRGWDRLRLVCSQPYCQTRPFGLSFVRLFSPPEDNEAPPEAPVRRLGHFTVREEGGSPLRPPGALFYQRPPSPQAPPKDPPGPSYAVATLQASAGSGPKAPKRRPLPPKANGSPRQQPKSRRPAAASPPPPPPAASPGGSPPPPAGPILAGVVLALSGFENPLRSRLRAAALALGASYRPDWTPDCTHLVCAFPRTPKAARARALGGLLVGPAWLWDCQRRQRRLPCGPRGWGGHALWEGPSETTPNGDYPMGGVSGGHTYSVICVGVWPPKGEAHGGHAHMWAWPQSYQPLLLPLTSGTSWMAPPPPAARGRGLRRPRPLPPHPPAQKTPPPPAPAPSGGPGTPPNSDPPGSDSGDGDDQSEREDPYGGSTEENSEEEEEEEGEKEPIPPLPDFFKDKTFFLHGEFPAGEGRLLLRYVTAFGGTLAPYMNDSVTHVVTAQDWDPAFEEALELRPSLTFVRPRWLLLCGERQRPLPAQPFAVVPRP